MLAITFLKERPSKIAWLGVLISVFGVVVIAIGESEGVAFLSARNISRKFIDLSTAKYISREDHNDFSKRVKIKKGDVLIGLPSTGLQTNGYSLARKVIFETAGMKLSDLVPGTKVTFEKTLLAIHKSYLNPVCAVMKKVDIHGMAHITGGGLYDNVPRVLPDNVDAQFDRSAWKTPAIYEFIEERGQVDHEEMYRVFNMGIGYVLMVGKKDVEATLKILKANKQRAIIVVEVVAGTGKSGLIN